MICDQIIKQCLSSHLMRRLLREPKLTLEICCSFEASERQASQIKTDSLKTTDSNLGVNAIRSQNKVATFPASTTQTGRLNFRPFLLLSCFLVKESKQNCPKSL